MKNQRTIKQMRGYSIIEFMVAITLGAMLVVGVSSVYLSNKTTYNIQDALARMQENGRYAKLYLAQVLRMASFQGCNNQNIISMNNLVISPPESISFNNPVMGYEGTDSGWTPALPSGLSDLTTNSDVIEVRMASNSGVSLSESMAAAVDPIAVPNKLGISGGDILIITDCELGDIFRAGTGTSNTSITHTTTDNTSASLSKAYQPDAQVMEFEYYAFYIKDSGRTNQVGNPILSLFQQDVNGTESEIVEGIEFMRVTYGIDTTNNGTADTYSTASAVNTANQWPQVVSIDIDILLNSIDDVAVKPQVYTFLGTTIIPTDRLLRQEWNNYISIRNRGL